MKKRLNVHSLCAITFAVGLVLLVTTGPAGSDAHVIDHEEYSTSTFRFARERDGKNWLLTYSFQESHEKWHDVKCRIPDAESRALEGSFGLREREWNSAKARYFQEAILAAYPRLDWGTVVVTENPGSLSARWVPVREPLLPAEELVAATEKQAFDRWYAQNGQSLYDKAAEKFRSKRGFIQHTELGKIPDYPGLIEKSAWAMKDCVEELNRVTGGEPALLMKFFQSMRFKEIEVIQDGKETGGLKLPCALMLSGQGDCDSKVAAYCLIQRKHSGVVIFRSRPGRSDPRHALVGVEAYRLKSDSRAQAKSQRSIQPWTTLREGLYEEPILIDNVYYWPCEVAGGEEGSRQPLFKEVAIGHAGDYVPIPIQPSTR